MRSAGDLRSDKRRRRVERVRINFFKRIAPHIVVSVARRCRKMLCADAIFAHGFKHLVLIVFRHAVYLFKSFFQSVQRLFAKFCDFRAYSEFRKHFFCIHTFTFIKIALHTFNNSKSPLCCQPPCGLISFMLLQIAYRKAYFSFGVRH